MEFEFELFGFSNIAYNGDWISNEIHFSCEDENLFNIFFNDKIVNPVSYSAYSSSIFVKEQKLDRK